MPVSQEVLDSLKVDLAMEHGAIFQYVIHAIQLRDTPLADAIKQTSREEMWHLEWLVEALTERGSAPVTDRADVFVSESIGESIRQDVATEDVALAHYASTLELIGDDDRELSRLIQRIMEDERHHRTKFSRQADEIEQRGDAAFEPTPSIPAEDLKVVGPTVAAEYAGILQYLWNKYGCGDCDQGETYFDMAIDEMRHAGWAAAYVAGFGRPQPAPVPVDRVEFVTSTSEAAERAREYERHASGFYEEKIGEARSESLREDLERAAGQHHYHAFVLKKMG